MREYIFPVLSLAFFTAICETFLPRGHMRRFATPILSLAVSCAILLPLFSTLGSPEKLASVLPEAETMFETDLYSKSIETEYKNRITAEIEKRGAEADVILGENFAVDRIILSGEVPHEAMQYILFTLEVPRSHVEIR